MLNIGTAIRLLRESQGRKSIEVAFASEISPGMLSQVENGKKSPSIDVLRRIASALNVPSDVLILIASSGGGSISTEDRASLDIADALQRLEAACENLAARIRGDAK